MNKIRVRIPPSPTGNLHVGTARTALFNELFARREGGQTVLRFEDTDRVRSKLEFEKNILEGLRWLGITWDEGPDIGGEFGPYRQSERTKIYQKEIERLLSEGKAYKEGEAVKLRVTSQEVVFEDLVRGKVATHTDAWGGDFVIARSTTDALYHLAVVIDDEYMEISHVIRGEDHISNTARQILIQEALRYSRPLYAHVPLLLDSSRRKLSKRAGDTDLLAYRDMGYLPEAMMNYLAQLGWSPKDDREYLTREELIQAFGLGGIQKAGAFFSLEKLQAMNKHYLRKLSGEELYDRVQPFLEHTTGPVGSFTPTRRASQSLPGGGRGAPAAATRDYLIAALKTEQERIATLQELAEAIKFFLPDWSADYTPEILIWKKNDKEKTTELLKLLSEKLEGFSEADFTKETLEKNLMIWIDENKLGRGDTLWPMRVALTGKENSPGPFEVAAVLGKNETVKRLTAALTKLHG